MKQGPFPHRRLCCPRGSIGTTGPSATLPAGTRLRGIPLIRAHRFPATTSQRPGPGRASPAPTSTMRPFRSPYPGRFITAALPGSTRLPWPSPQIPGLGSPLSPEGAKITGRQDSHNATDRPLAHPQGALDAGLRHRAFPPDAASLLPGLLAATRTGPTPAGECELTFRSGHYQAPPPNSGHTDPGSAQTGPGAVGREGGANEGSASRARAVGSDQVCSGRLGRPEVGRLGVLIVARPARRVGERDEQLAVDPLI